MTKAHHVKKNHSGNLIMQRFYFDPARACKTRPAILSLTASPSHSGKASAVEYA